MEQVPGLLHLDWFHNEIKIAAGIENTADGTETAAKYQVVPLLGFSADWAGPEKWEDVKQKQYQRGVYGSHIQVPVRLVDWSAYVREAVRECAGKAAAWEFWENPDHRGSPAYIPPALYPQMLRVVRQWVDLYDPGKPIIAGGFSSDHAYEYLRQIKEPHTLPFDCFGLQFSLGELSPESADMEGLVDDLDSLLKLTEQGRQLDVPQLDWPIGEHVSPIQQGAYHARAVLIMQRSLDDSYRLTLLNETENFEGFGLFHRRPFGNTRNFRDLRPLYLPKPACFALIATRDRLKSMNFNIDLRLPDRDSTAGRAYLYEKDGGRWSLALWRARGGARAYRVPPAWSGVELTDAFGTAFKLRDNILDIGPIPVFVDFPQGYGGPRIRQDVRLLETADGLDRPLLALYPTEQESAGAAKYRAEGTAETVSKRDRWMIGGEPVELTFLTGITEETFEFKADEPGTCRLVRTWFSDDGVTGSRLKIVLNDQREMIWDLAFSELGKRFKQAGIRESSLLLHNVVSGVNKIRIFHTTPGNIARWAVMPLLDKTSIDLTDLHPLNALQIKGRPLYSTNATGTPLTIGERKYTSGIGTLSPAQLEYPLHKQFSRFEVTVGIDSETAGRGSVIFSLYADDDPTPIVSSESMTGFSEPATLVAEDLEEVSRLRLIVVNAEASDAEALANWVNAKLYMKNID